MGSEKKDPFPFLRTAGRDWMPGGELPGVRDTRDQLIRDEMSRGFSREIATRQVDKVVREYDQSVSAGLTPFPLKKR